MGLGVGADPRRAHTGTPRPREKPNPGEQRSTPDHHSSYPQATWPMETLSTSHTECMPLCYSAYSPTNTTENK
ncbi:hypothetical protein M404DRAFT_992017 [Pisolithus tinctorius Marx 270]|uniref:Uncharacterized protein n=1 Tax=Pisolithus tinctorius Marx 270 TaxID=870435 RepID=A0A0C3PWN9_PISTI|nr:hypothetical protein M404DRAFT_992017 [Pisolithus tinctorius Marx 270]